MKKFALIGAAGFVARRHLEAIRRVGGDLVAALDLHDSVGVLDSFFPDCRFFTSPERFDRFLNKKSGEIDYVSVCSPNWLHDAHCRWALRSGADAICEKPLVLHPRNADQLVRLEDDTGRRVHPVLQLRLHPAVCVLKSRLAERAACPPNGRAVASVYYVTRRGRWYAESWKGDEAKSGGILMNLGIHFFDMACWLFGSPEAVQVLEVSASRASGTVDFDGATMDWSLSSEARDLPARVREAGAHAHRRIVVDGEPVDFSEGFDRLHDAVYEQVLAGTAPSVADARPAIELVRAIRESAR